MVLDWKKMFRVVIKNSIGSVQTKGNNCLFIK